MSYERGAINHVQYSGHNGLGQPGTASYANGVTTTYTYSNSGNSTCPQDNYRLCTQRTVHGSSPVYQDLRYTYYNVGNVHEIFDNLDANNTQTFIYDELNRLTSAEATAYGTISYVYNEIGNMMTNSQVGSYTYPTNGIRPHAVQTSGSNTYNYDDNGNMTSGAGRTITYDYDNRPVSITAGGDTTTFFYDGVGNRVRKTANGVTTVYIGKLYENTPDGCIKYVFAGSQRIAMRDTTGALFYYHTDHLGSSSVMTDAAGNMVEHIAYFPYGQTRINTGTKDMHHKFTGQELDAETGLYFYGARYYDPQLGRFISADTIVPNPRNPQDLNRYSYVSNNPLNYIDPTGHSWFSKAWHDIEDSISKTVRKANAWLDNFFERNDINVNVGTGGTIDSSGHPTRAVYNPETGEISPYMPVSAASVNTVSIEINFNSGTIQTENELYAEAYASADESVTDGRPYTRGEMAYEAALIYEGESKMNCNDLVMKAYSDAGYETGYINTRNLSSSSYFLKVATPGTGDVVLWPKQHMGLFVAESEGVRVQGVPANIFHAPGILSSHKIGYSRMEWLYNRKPEYYRYIGK